MASLFVSGVSFALFLLHVRHAWGGTKFWHNFLWIADSFVRLKKASKHSCRINANGIAQIGCNCNFKWTRGSRSSHSKADSFFIVRLFVRYYIFWAERDVWSCHCGPWLNGIEIHMMMEHGACPDCCQGGGDACQRQHEKLCDTHMHQKALEPPHKDRGQMPRLLGSQGWVLQVLQILYIKSVTFQALLVAHPMALNDFSWRHSALELP